MASVMPHTNVPTFNEEFSKGKPKALGIVTICAAILQIVLESVLRGIGVFGLQSYISYWGPVFYIIGGSLAIAASKKEDVGLVKATMILNIITSILSAIALILSIANIVLFSWLLPAESSYIHTTLTTLIIIGIVLSVVILLTNLLLLSTSITISVFASRALRQANTQSSTQTFIIHNQTTVPVVPGAVPTMYPSYTQPPPPAGYNEDHGTRKPAK